MSQVAWYLSSTGYSSLIYLRRLPIDGLKVDRSFVAGLTASSEDRVIVERIVSLAHSLGLVALAEGVETEQQGRTPAGPGLRVVGGRARRRRLSCSTTVRA